MRLAGVSLAAVLAFLLLAVGPIWFNTWFEANVPRYLVRGATIAFLQALRVVYLLALAATLAGTVAFVLRVKTARRRRESINAAARGLLLCVSTLVSLAAMEGAAAVWSAWTHRLPRLPLQFDDPASDDGVIDLAVVGESSAEGHPYHPWLSVGQIVAWQLERVLPGRKVRVEMLASGGICLEQAIYALYGLKHRPEIILIFAGHNEFQARYGWSRNVRYYQEEGPVRVRSLVAEQLARISPLCRMIAETIERHGLDTPPPPHVTRELVDHPAYTSEEYEFLRSDFHRRLEAVTVYAEEIGALPILIMPAGNDADFPPSRSMLDPDTTESERVAFSRSVEAAMALEATDPDRAIASYRVLIDQHPEFAETHFRLAFLLEQKGRWAEAIRHQTLARDHDGMPMRCPSDFQAAYPTVASRHDVVLVDGPKVLRALHPHGLLDDLLFHDAQHPTFRGYLALAQNVLDQLKARRAFGWPDATPSPVIDPNECARHFGLDAARWADICEKTAMFYARIAYIRYDPSRNLAMADHYVKAAAKIAAGTPLSEIEIPGLGIEPRDLAHVKSRTASPATARPAPSARR